MEHAFDYFRSAAGPRARPDTAEAMRALEEGSIPVAAFVHFGTSVLPLEEGSLSPEELTRRLIHERPDRRATVSLLQALRRLRRSPDRELARKAAGSIGLVQSRYAREIEALKRKLVRQGQGQGRETLYLRALARRCYELAQLQAPPARNLHLRDSYGYLKRLARLRRLTRGELTLLVELLLQLRLPGQALELLRRPGRKADPFYLVLQARAELQRRDLPRLQQLCLRLAELEGSGAEPTTSFLAYWLGREEGSQR
jgi:hypothetical protein